MKSFTNKNMKTGTISKIETSLGKNARRTLSVFSLMAITALGSNAYATSPLNHPPTDVVISSTDINELQPVGTTVGALSSIDQDNGDTFTYTLVSGIGDEDNESFSIDLNKLQSGASFDFVTKSSYNIRLRTTDAMGESFEKAITVNIKHLPPVISDLTDSVELGHTHNFSLSEFSGAFSVPNGMSLNSISINTLPSYGTLQLNGTAVSQGAILSASDIDHLVYSTTPAYTGDADFVWNATDGLGYFANTEAKVILKIQRTRNITGSMDAVSAAGYVLANSQSPSATRIPTETTDSVVVGSVSQSGSGSTRNPAGQDANSSSRLGNTTGNASIAGIEENNTAPEILIHNCYPNPFSQGATIKYQLPTDGKVEIKVYNSAGAEIGLLVSEKQTAGVHTTDWNGKNNSGLQVSSGQYYYFINVKDAEGKQVSSNSGVMIKL